MFDYDELPTGADRDDEFAMECEAEAALRRAPRNAEEAFLPDELRPRPRTLATFDEMWERVRLKLGLTEEEMSTLLDLFEEDGVRSALIRRIVRDVCRMEALLEGLGTLPDLLHRRRLLTREEAEWLASWVQPG